MPRTVLLSLLAACLFSGCAYRADLAQGNYIEQQLVDLLRPGMTAEQVRYVLGTPMLIDPFDQSRWYYVHYLREGWNDPVISRLIAIFNGTLLVDIDGDYRRPAAFSTPAPPADPAQLHE